MFIEQIVRAAHSIQNKLDNTDLEDTILIIEILAGMGIPFEKMRTLAETGALYIWPSWDEIIEDTFLADEIYDSVSEIDFSKVDEYIALLRRTNRFFAISPDYSRRKSQVLEIRQNI